MKKIVYLIFLSLLFLAECGQPKYPSTCKQVLKDYFNLIEEARNKKKTNEIIENLDHFIDKNPNCINSYLLIGDIYFSLNHYDSSKKNFLVAINIDSNNVYALFKLGLIYQFGQNYDSAIVYFTNAEQKKNIGGFVINKSKDLEKIIETPNFDVDYVDIIFNRGKANYYANHLSHAKQEFDYCIREDKSLKEAFFFRGLIYLKNNDFKNGCKDIESAVANGNIEAKEYIEKYCKEK